ncbi:hypothetical protein ACFE04_001046 [Oxalis oulophora]
MESTDSSFGSSAQLQLPTGFRFHPTDEELLVHYLKRKTDSVPLPVSIIADIDLYKFDPWELPSKATFGEQEWYFFTPRDRKYPNGARPNRAATSGYWKATGTDKPILASNGTNNKIGVKKALVFYNGKPPKGIKTNWIMHEYRLIQNHLNHRPQQLPLDLPNKKGSLRLDDWVLCRIYKKHNSQRPIEREREEDSSSTGHNHGIIFGTKNGPMLIDSEENNFFDGMITDHHGMQNNQFASSGGSASTTTTATFPVKQLPVPPLPPQYWNNNNNNSGKRIHDYLNNNSSNNVNNITDDQDENDQNNNNNSYVLLLNQLPQAGAPIPYNTNMVVDGDGVFRPQYQLPNMNWNS